MEPIKKTFTYGAHQVTLETGEIARQADGDHERIRVRRIRVAPAAIWILGEEEHRERDVAQHIGEE